MTASSPGRIRARRQVVFELGPTHETASYPRRRRRARACSTFTRVSRSRMSDLAREYWFELLVVLWPPRASLELVVGRDSPGAPTTSLWFAVPAWRSRAASVRPPVGFPSRAPAAYWILAAALSFVNGVLIPLSRAWHRRVGDRRPAREPARREAGEDRLWRSCSRHRDGGLQHSGRRRRPASSS